MRNYDVIVVGGGHAGCEAASAAARLGCATALVTTSLSRLGKMPCNPSIGGPGKSQLVCEIDALGGEMARMTDACSLTLRLLNTSKGVAMQVQRAQVDRFEYQTVWKARLESLDGLDLIEGTVDEILFAGRGSSVRGVRLLEGLDIGGRAVVIAAGTFLRGRVLIGRTAYGAGRAGEPPSIGLAKCLERLGLSMGRLNTGTTPRLNARSIDYAGLELQQTRQQPSAFSFWSEPRVCTPGFPVAVTRTTEETHRVIRDNLHLSPGYSGEVESEGPRHCPSLETKIVKFPQRTSHKVFLEREGRNTEEVYVQGVYVSLPPTIQEELIHTIPGLERAVIQRFGYKIEYDYVDPMQLSPSMAVAGIDGLYLAGQINGTTGYEEAAGQGLLAGINAARSVSGAPAIVLGRHQAFLGVLTDDLTSKGVREPYRMLPSRAEYRILLREQNADLRLAHLGHEIGLIDEEQLRSVEERDARIRRLLDELHEVRIGPADPRNAILADRGTHPLQSNGASLYELLRRPEVRLEDLVEVSGIPESVRSEVTVLVKYEGYLEQQEREIARLKRWEDLRIPDHFNFAEVPNLSVEGRELLAHVRPHSLGQAGRVSGVSHADLAMLAVALRAYGSPAEASGGIRSS
ncbi:tRNA uridine-5-carboxymethylaminomethyl(34) synthesis enzyme MnmG [Candidatus Bipolaricaulota bacterium]|nr:tRNA uridine-5-carboxymethylaminomethyl(34) synthesis enzyme MnmG [Candidatus Bipolaricaulota bacterium]